AVPDVIICAAWGHAAYTMSINACCCRPGRLTRRSAVPDVIICAAWGHAAYTIGVCRLAGRVPSPGDKALHAKHELLFNARRIDARSGCR
ncbi:MAG TPA: hypothetical protein P5534_17175, partial [Candidatus Paceibacterota bacterium]|nr:hypothetical protein [Candidatus Paceibacterota bacterium]